MISTQDWADARRVWDYHQMGHAPRPCSVAVGLGSHDLGVADTAVDLYKRGLAPLLVFGPGRPGRSYSGALHLDALNHARSTVCGSTADGMGAGGE